MICFIIAKDKSTNPPAIDIFLLGLSMAFKWHLPHLKFQLKKLEFF